LAPDGLYGFFAAVRDQRPIVFFLEIIAEELRYVLFVLDDENLFVHG
jgi:hypothetical protein